MDPNDSDRAWVGHTLMNPEGVYSTSNGGSSWAAANVNIESESVTALWLSSACVLFAGTYDGELWPRESGQTGWSLATSLTGTDTITGL